jgi:hypothetical protein
MRLPKGRDGQDHPPGPHLLRGALKVRVSILLVEVRGGPVFRIHDGGDPTAVFADLQDAQMGIEEKNSPVPASAHLKMSGQASHDDDRDRVPRQPLGERSGEGRALQTPQGQGVETQHSGKRGLGLGPSQDPRSARAPLLVLPRMIPEELIQWRGARLKAASTVLAREFPGREGADGYSSVLRRRRSFATASFNAAVGSGGCSTSFRTRSKSSSFS